MEPRTAYTGGRFTLELDGKKPVGFVSAIDGGHFKSDPVVSMYGRRPGQTGGDLPVQKFAGKPKYEDIAVTVGGAMSPDFWKWVADTIANSPDRKDGAIVGYDFDKKERARRTFQRALISEVTFPACDASNKGGSQLTVKFSPEKLEYTPGNGAKMTLDEPAGGLAKQKRWTQASFRFNVDGVGLIPQAKIEAITVKQNVIRNPVGPELETRIEVGMVELPNLVVTVPESGVKPWLNWFKSGVVQGGRATVNASLTYLAPDSTTELATLSFFRLGLLSVELDKLEASKDGIQNAKITMFMEHMTVKGGAGTT